MSICTFHCRELVCISPLHIYVYSVSVCHVHHTTRTSRSAFKPVKRKKTTRQFKTSSKSFQKYRQESYGQVLLRGLAGLSPLQALQELLFESLEAHATLQRVLNNSVNGLFNDTINFSRVPRTHRATLSLRQLGLGGDLRVVFDTVHHVHDTCFLSERKHEHAVRLGLLLCDLEVQGGQAQVTLCGVHSLLRHGYFLDKSFDVVEIVYFSLGSDTLIATLE
ncbi:uncharacterized protein BDZ99DRAFT_280469 [Mytilinidion resinicola]|uniref:Uncharacterized protein n=1 Tax=Mytilinidion resinicola TaxID=574789 RepID=A0A6A6YS60_9PEZI|nr:uncharacterized protein BDZ99DRAFT_280469 [Mytilinidion resinicola]KAF2811762.1 hypothetical protein BDZ99DRAFT_280469 [Mytilinidion resinicola]